MALNCLGNALSNLGMEFVITKCGVLVLKKGNEVNSDWIEPETEAVAWRCSVKEMFIEISRNSPKTPVPNSLF